MPCPPSSSSARLSGDKSFEAWLEQRLCDERSIILEKLQAAINLQLETHRTALVSQFTSCFDNNATTLEQCSVKANSEETPADREDNTEGPPELARLFNQSEFRRSMTLTGVKMDSELEPSPVRNEQQRVTCHLQKDELLESRGQGALARFVHSPTFEIISVVLILINTLQLAVEIQYSGYQSGYLLEIDGYTVQASDRMPGFAEAFKIISMIFCGIFVVELMLRIMVLKSAAIRSKWIWLDVVLVFLGFMDVMDVTLVTGVNPTMMRLLRITRLVRLGKVLTKSSAFDSLFLLIKSLQASCNALVWSFLLLLAIQTAVGMILAQYFIEVMRSASHDYQTRKDLFAYFGTFTKTMVTMFEISVGNWVVTCRFLMKFSEWFGLFYILYRCMVCFAIVSVIGAVFIAETGRIAAGDDNVAMMRKERQQQAYSRRVHQLFSDLDSDDDGIVTWDEFEAIAQDATMQNYLATFEVDVADLERLFRVLDNGDGTIEVEEFVNGITAVQGPAKSFDVIVLSKTIKKIDKKMNAALKVLRASV